MERKEEKESESKRKIRKEIEQKIKTGQYVPACGKPPRMKGVEVGSEVFFRLNVLALFFFMNDNDCLFVQGN